MSDGTTAGTVLVKDIRPGAYDGYPYHLAGVGGTLFFTARDGIHGRELWTSDGTRAGTVLVRDIHPGAREGDPTHLTGVGGTLFFTADDGTQGRELWKSDGTEAGTVLVKDINAGGGFDVSRGTPNTNTGTISVRVDVAGAGRLAVGPVAGSLIKRVVRDVDSAGSTKVTLRPTKAGMRILKRDGRLPVKARFTFTPCGGAGSSVIHRYTLRLR
jgi:ELWxxDGT repeat protein